YIADKVHHSTVSLSNALKELGYQQYNASYFDTLLIEADASKIRPLAEAQQINFLYPENNKVAISLNETVSVGDLNTIVEIFADVANKQTVNITEITSETSVLEANQRQSTFLENEVFNNYHSETELMRYIKKLERK